MNLTVFNTTLESTLKSIRDSGGFNEWLEEVPSEPKRDRDWQAVTVEGTRYHCYAKTGELYPETSAFWEFGKALTIYSYAHWFFGAHCVKGIASEIYQNVSPFYEMFKNYKVCRMDVGFSWSNFAELNEPLFANSGNHLRQAAKSFALFAALYFDPKLYGLPLGTALRGAMIGCMVIKPLSFRVLFNRVERWWLPEGLEVKDAKEWSVMDQFCSLARLFNMQRLKSQDEKEKKE